MLHDTLWTTADKYGDNTAFDTPEGTLTYSQFTQRSVALAAGLQKFYVDQGDRIAILAPNCTDYLAYHYACSLLGCVLVVLNTRLSDPEIIYICNNANARVFVVHEEFAQRMPALENGCESVQFFAGIGQLDGADVTTHELVSVEGELVRPKKQQETDPLLLIYTSGTTGKPKGAMQTHKGMNYIDKASANLFGTRADDIYLAFLPYFHQAGLARTRAVMINGGKVLIPPKMNIEELAACLQQQRVSITNLLPPIDYQLMELAQQQQLHFPHLKTIIGGGGMGKLHGSMMQQFCTATRTQFIGIYGQTEVTGPATAIKSHDYFERPASCGKPIVGTELAIWDDKHNELQAQQCGEIMVRSPGCVPGYWQNEDASDALYTNGWLHTGDLGRLDEQGFLYFEGRKKELIKTGGENVYPKEIEDVLWQHPNIRDLTVLGLPDPGGWGEKVAALITTKNGQPLTVKDIKAFCVGKIASYKVPKEVKCIEQIPRNFAGKTAKYNLVALFDDQPE